MMSETDTKNKAKEAKKKRRNAKASLTRHDIEHRNNPERKGANSEVTGASGQFDSAYGSSIADSGVTNRSQAIHQQDGPTSIGAVTHQAAHVFPSGSGTTSSDERGIGAVQADSRPDGIVEEAKSPQEFADTPTSPVVREDGPNCEQAKKDVYQSVPENDPDVLAGEGQQPGSAGRYENNMEVLKDASDVAPQVTSDAHQDDDTGASHSELHTSTATPEETDHQVGSHQAMQDSIFHILSHLGQYKKEDASSSPVPEQESQVTLEGLPGLLGDPIRLNYPTPDVNMNVFRVDRQIPVQEHHGQQPGRYDEARVVDRLRYGEPTSDVRYREDGPVQESGNQLQDDYNVNRAIQLVNSGQRLLGGRDFQEEGADGGGTDE